METPAFVERTEPESVFSLLSDDKRVGILRALWDRKEPMSFSVLHDAVDIRDSGQFNYHLDKLVGQFVVKEEEGYALTEAGRQINGAIDAGSYTTEGSMEPLTLDPPCPTCGGERTLEYESERVTVDCEGCDVVARFAIPPATLAGRDKDEIPRIAGRYLRTGLSRLESGFCTYCNGPVDRTVLPLVESSSWEPPSEDSEVDQDQVRNLPAVQYECRQCGLEPTSGLTIAVLSHPAVVGFYADHGIDIRNRSIWTFNIFGPDSEDIRSRDPFRASVTFRIDDDELTVVVDENLDSIDIE